jgi:hypothetical protein
MYNYEEDTPLISFKILAYCRDNRENQKIIDGNNITTSRIIETCDEKHENKIEMRENLSMMKLNENKKKIQGHKRIHQR